MSIGLKGVAIPSHIRAKEIGSTKFRKFWAKAEELDLPVYIHPRGFTHDDRLHEYFLWNSVGQPLEETLAMTSIIYEGILDDFPKLKIIIAHGGGYLPYYAGRTDKAYDSRPETRKNITAPPSTYLSRFFYDTVIFDRDMLELLVKKAGNKQVMMGTDYPRGEIEEDPIGFITKSKFLSATSRDKIMGLMQLNCSSLKSDLGRVVTSLLVSLAAMLLFTSNALAADKIKVDLELVIATDVSRSIYEEEARLQREGIAAALRSPYVLAAIRSGYQKKIAITYIDYSSREFNETIVDWRIVHDKQSANSFADALMEQPLTFGRRTSISDALEMAAAMILENNIEGKRRTIDVAGDGPNNDGRLVDEVRNEVLRKGITINGLPIINNNPGFGTRFNLPDLHKYYRGCVIGGTGAFLIIAKDFPDFARAIRRKLIFEIADALPQQTFVQRIAETNTNAGFVYEKGCDIGEKMWRQIWGDQYMDP